MQQSNQDRSTSLAKLSPPRLSAVYPRTRLFNLLNAARERPVVWISALAGSGKTTLVADYLKSQGLKTIWYQIDAGDVDAASLFYYLGLSVTRTAAQQRKPMPVLAPEFQAGLHVFTRNYFRKFFARIKHPGVLVLDNYQEVPNDAILHELLTHAFEEIPEHINIIVISRADPPPAFARLQVNDQIKLLSSDDLKLTPEESLGIAQLRKDEPSLDSQSIHVLHELTQGWMAGLVLLLEQAHSQSNFTNNIPEAPGAVFDYFASEVLRRTEPQTRDFLLKTAFLKKVTAPVARELTGRTDAEAILKDLTKRNYFTTQHTGVQGSYEYHPLFQSFLVDCAMAEFTSEQIRQLKQRSALLLVQAGDIDTAVSLLLEAEDWADAMGIILQHATILVSQGRLQTLTQWLLALPATLREQQPWILYWLGMSRLAFNPAEARTYLEPAFTAFSQLNDATPICLTWSGIVDSYVMEWLNFAPLQKWLDMYSTLLSGRTPPAPQAQAAAMVSYFSGLTWSRFDEPELPDIAQRVEALFLQSRDPNQWTMVGPSIVAYWLWKGEILQAQRSLQITPPTAEMAHTNPLAYINWHGWNASVAAIAGLSDESMASTREAFSWVEQSGVHVLDCMLLKQTVYCSLSVGDLAAARATLAKLAPWVSLGFAYDGYHKMLMSAVTVHEGKTSALTEQELRSAIDTLRASYVQHIEGMCYAVLAAVLIAEGNTQGALQAVSDAYALADQQGSHLQHFMCGYVEANVWRILGDKERVLAILRDVLTLGREKGLRVSGWLPRHDASILYNMALEAQIYVDDVRTVIQNIHLPPPLDNVSEHWPYPLKIYTLGRFNVVIRGEPLRFSGKTQKRPLDVLKFLVVQGGRDVAEDKMTEYLWPDAEADDANVALTTAIHRLRKLLGEDVIVRGQGKLSLDTRYCWVDVWDFERNISELHELVRQAKLDEVWPCVEKLFRYYNGDLLGSEPEQAWMIAPRERLRNRLLRALEAAGQVLSQSDRYSQAEACYEKGLEVIPLAESLYRQLINLHLDQQHHSDALLVYKRCCKVLSTQLGLDPSPELRALKDKIVTANSYKNA